MRVQCPQCGSGGNIPDGKIPANGTRIVCPKCKTSFFIAQHAAAETHTPEQRASASYQQGVLLLKKKQIDAAIEQFTQAIHVAPHYHEVYRHLGVAYGQKGLWEDAVHALQKAITYKSDDALALKNLGIAYLQQKHYAQAEQVFRQALQYTPEDRKAQAYLAKAVQGKGKEPLREPASHVSSGSNGKHSSPSSAQRTSAHCNPVQDLLDQGVVCLDNAQYNKAIDAFQEATRVAPNNSDGYYGLGLVYEKRKDWDKALSAYQKAVDLNPDDSPAKEGLRFVKKQRRKSRFSWWKRLRHITP